MNLLEGSSKSYYYSLANKFFDYIHSGVPSINMDFPEYRAINEQWEVSLLLNKLEQEELRTAIESLWNDTDLYRQLRENCLNCRKELNWQQEEKKLLSIYNAIV